MQTPVTVVMLLHDTATENDQPVCKVLTGCSWREMRRTSASGDPQRVVHIRLPPAPGPSTALGSGGTHGDRCHVPSLTDPPRGEHGGSA